MDGIRLSEKHGVNPSLGVCFWCGEDDGTVLLLGKLDRGGMYDVEAPRRCCVSYEPCDKCKEVMAQGILFFEATDTPNHKGQPAMANGAYPTGRWVVLKEEAVGKVISDEDMLARTLKYRKAAMEPEAYAQVFGWMEAGGE